MSAYRIIVCLGWTIFYDLAFQLRQLFYLSQDNQRQILPNYRTRKDPKFEIEDGHCHTDHLSNFAAGPLDEYHLVDLGYGGARRALHNLSQKSARILSAAITRTILLPAGVRGSRDGFHSGLG